MGNTFSNWLSFCIGKKPFRVIMVGLDSAGKTTILYKLKLRETVETIPTIGFNVETVQHNNVEFTVWDLHSQDKSRPLWRHYFDGTSAVIFVVDSGDANRFAECKEVLHTLLQNEEVITVPVLILANKQDIATAASPAQITEVLDLKSLAQPWFVQGTCAITSEGFHQALNWLSKAVTKT